MELINCIIAMEPLSIDNNIFQYAFICMKDEDDYHSLLFYVFLYLYLSCVYRCNININVLQYIKNNVNTVVHSLYYIILYGFQCVSISVFLCIFTFIINRYHMHLCIFTALSQSIPNLYDFIVLSIWRLGLSETNSLLHLLDKFEKYDKSDLNLKHSKYFNEPALINITKQYDNGLVMLSLNAKSYREFLENIICSTIITVLCLKETWLLNDSSFNYFKYNAIFNVSI